jgi:hypothetical protein
VAKYEVYVGDVGTQLRFDIGSETADVTTAKIKVRKPDKSCVEWSADIGPGATEITYTVVAGDLDMKGKFVMQPYIELPGWSGFGKSVDLNVLAPVCA